MEKVSQKVVERNHLESLNIFCEGKLRLRAFRHRLRQITERAFIVRNAMPRMIRVHPIGDRGPKAMTPDGNSRPASRS